MTSVPKLVVTQDNEFWFAAAREGRLVIQRCVGCGELRHPPAPVCARCRSFEWDSVESSGFGVLYSYAISYYPRDPAFSYPLVVGLVELAEGVRMVADMPTVDPERVWIGMPVEVAFAPHSGGVLLPTWRERA